MSETSRSHQSVAQAYRMEARRHLAACQDRIKHCVGQLDDAQVWWRPTESMNSIANIMLHLCGNLRQWLVSGVGGETDVRNRPQEFAERGPIAKDELLSRLEIVVTEADAALAQIEEARWLEVRRIQGFEETVLGAVFDCLTHLRGHTQEIVYITRLQLGDSYRFAWVPKTAEQGAVPEEGGETIAVRDAVFEEMPGHPLPAKVAISQEVPITSQAAPVEIPATEAEAEVVPHHEESPLNDYLLELEQEFQDDEEKGKL
jgi:Protein of unknown function (DUF1572)